MRGRFAGLLHHRLRHPQRDGHPRGTSGSQQGAHPGVAWLFESTPPDYQPPVHVYNDSGFLASSFIILLSCAGLAGRTSYIIKSSSLRPTATYYHAGPAGRRAVPLPGVLPGDGTRAEGPVRGLLFPRHPPDRQVSLDSRLLLERRYDAPPSCIMPLRCGLQARQICGAMCDAMYDAVIAGLWRMTRRATSTWWSPSGSSRRRRTLRP